MGPVGQGYDVAGFGGVIGGGALGDFPNPSGGIRLAEVICQSVAGAG